MWERIRAAAPSRPVVRGLLAAIVLVAGADLAVVAERRPTGDSAAAVETAFLFTPADLEAKLLDLSAEGYVLVPPEQSKGLTGPLDRDGAARLDPAAKEQIRVLLHDLEFVAGYTRLWQGAQWNVLNFVFVLAQPASSQRYVELARRTYARDGEVELVSFPAVPGAAGYRRAASPAGIEAVLAHGAAVYGVVVVGEPIAPFEAVAALVAAQFTRAAAG